MKKSKVLRTSTRLSDLNFDDLYVDDYDDKSERWNIRKLRDFKRGLKG